MTKWIKVGVDGRKGSKWRIWCTYSCPLNVFIFKIENGQYLHISPLKIVLLLNKSHLKRDFQQAPHQMF